MPTRAQLIADLKGRGVGGKLSKMNKSQLSRLAEQHGGRRRPVIELEPLPTPATPLPSPTSRKLNPYQRYVSQHMKENPGSTFAQAAAAYKQHKAGQSDEHMQAMDDALKEGQSLNEAHEEAVEKVDEADYLDKYMSGGSYYDNNKALSDEELSDGEESLEQYMEGGNFWQDINPADWSKDTWGTVASAVGIGLLAMGGDPEAAAEEEETQAAAAADKAGAQDKDIFHDAVDDTQEPVNAAHNPGGSAPTLSSNEAPLADGEEPEPETEDMTFDQQRPGIGARARNYVRDKLPTREEAGTAFKRQYEKRVGLKKGTLDRRPDESKAYQIGRVAYASAPYFKTVAGTAAVEKGEQLKSEAESDKVKATVTAENKATREAIKSLERQREENRDAALAADWQRTRDRAENPYLN